MAVKKSTTKKNTKQEAAQKTAEAIHTKLTDVVMELVNSNGWTKLLQVMAEKNGTELSRYSFGNILLIWSQMPEATAVCSFRAWQDRGRSVLKGSTSLRINAPMSVKEKDENGIVRKSKDGADKTRTLFRLTPVFDASQTEPRWQDAGQGHALTITPALSKPRIATKITGNAPATMWDDLAGQVARLGYTLERGNTGQANGWTDPTTKTVRVSDTLSEAHSAKTLAHEVAHIICDHVSDFEEYRQHRGQQEAEAESVAFMISDHYGLDSSAYSAPYVATWAGKEPSEVLKMLQKTGAAVLKAYRSYLSAVESPEMAREQMELLAA